MTVFQNKGEQMLQKSNKILSRSGATLVEIMYAIAIMLIAMLGASGYRYYSSLNARWAGEQITQARVAQLLCASWAGVEGAETYDPTDHLESDLEITNLSPPDDLPPGFNLLGRYKITLEDNDYNAVLAWNDVSSDLRALRAKVVWDWLEEDPSDTTKALKKPYIIITYVSK